MPNNRKKPTQLHVTQKTFKSEPFFQRLKGAVVSAADTDFGTATSQILGMASVETVEEKAFELILSALGNACHNILKGDDEHQEMLNAVFSLNTQNQILNADFKATLEDIELSIDKSFFTAPHKTKFIKTLVPIYEQWLYKVIGFTAVQSRTLSTLLPFKFQYELAERWSNKPEYYKEIKDFFDNPFFEGIEQEGKKAAYYYELKKYYTDPVFASPEMTLADIYVKPNFKVYKKAYNEKQLRQFKKEDFDSDSFIAPETIHRNFHKYIFNLLNGKPSLELKAEQSRFTILLGQPGQGKTSFCLKCMYDLLSDNSFADNLYFVRLRYIENIKDIISNPLETLRKHIAKDAFQSDNPILLEDLNNAVLILDGLDELYMHQGLTNADIKDFVTGLSNSLKQYKDLKILLTTRYNYLDINQLSGEKYLVLKLDELSVNQQLEWLEKYKAIYKNCNLDAALIETINTSKDKKYEGIKELINQPILLQMIARSGLDLTQGSNRTKIYESLFDNIINRKWSEDGQLEKYEQLTKKDLRGFLQTIALAIYQSDFDYIRRNEFEDHELLTKAKDKFLRKTGNKLPLDDALKDILVSFYFKNKQKSTEDRDDKDRHNDYAIEFLHKSLQEYLVAEKIWQFFKTTFTRKDTDDEYIIDDWNTALKEIYPIISPKMLSREIADYLIEMVQNESNEALKNELATRLDSFLPALIKRDFLYQFDVNKEHTPFDKGLSTFYAYWTILSHLREKNTVKEVARKRFIFLLNPLKHLRYGLKINLSGIDLSGANLSGINLSEVNLSGANLSESNLIKVDLGFANLNSADLRKAYLIDANLKRVNLSGANLSETYLGDADLRRANLTEANLSDANLSDANLSRVDLNGVDLSQADLSDANLSWAKLIGAKLIGAKLGGVNLSRADLSGADLREAYLHEANLNWANLSGANLTGASLSRANLSNADLRGANLSGANLVYADLTEADLAEVDLTEADLRDAHLKGANLKKVDLRTSNLRAAANLREISLREANLSGLDLSNFDLREANLEEVNLSGARLSKGDFREANLSGANFSGAKLMNVDFREADLRGANFSGAELSYVNFNGVDFSEANLSKIKLSDADLSEASFQGANFSGARLNGTKLSGVDFRESILTEVNFSGAHLSQLNLSGFNLSGVNFSKANLSRADLSKTNLSKADLSEAKLGNTNLSMANLEAANLKGAHLSSTNLGKTNLSKADLSGARLYKVDLTTADLTDVIGLKTD